MNIATSALTSVDQPRDRKRWHPLGFFSSVFGKYVFVYACIYAAILLEGCLAAALAMMQKSGAPAIVSIVMFSAWTLPFLLWLGNIAIVLVVRRVDRPTRALLRMIRQRRIWFMRAGLLMTGSAAFGAFFGMVKSGIPALVPFYADGILANADRAMLGQDAWQLTDHLLGDLVTVVLDRSYMLWFPGMFCLVAYLFSTRDERLQAQGLFTFFLSWFALGSLLAMAGSSVGPIFYDKFYDQTTFAGLLAKLDRIDRIYTLDVGGVVQYLSNSNTVPKLGGGISAMPSMHVGIAFLGCMVFNKQGNSLLAVTSWTFFFAILLGSIDLGWHYLSDGIVSILGVWSIWQLAGVLIARIDRKHRAALVEGQPG